MEPWYGMPRGLELLLGAAVLVGLFLLFGGRLFSRWSHHPEFEDASQLELGLFVAHDRATEILDWEQQGWFDETDPELELAWACFVQARERARAYRRLSVVDQRVQTELYPNVTPLHEVYPGGAA